MRRTQSDNGMSTRDQEFLMSTLHCIGKGDPPQKMIFDSLSVSARLAKLYKIGLCPATSRAIWILGH